MGAGVEEVGDEVNMKGMVYVVFAHDGLGGYAHVMVYDSMEAAQIAIVGGIDKELKDDPGLFTGEEKKKYAAYKASYKWNDAISLFKKQNDLTVIQILEKEINSLCDGVPKWARKPVLSKK
jgi:hypothetical protein